MVARLLDRLHPAMPFAQGHVGQIAQLEEAKLVAD
jgi:hypothetical protein